MVVAMEIETCTDMEAAAAVAGEISQEIILK